MGQGQGEPDLGTKGDARGHLRESQRVYSAGGRLVPVPIKRRKDSRRESVNFPFWKGD